MIDKIQEFVGKEATINTANLLVKVIIKDVKNSWGHDRYLVSPVAGEGEVWVENVNLIQE